LFCLLRWCWFFLVGNSAAGANEIFVTVCLCIKSEQKTKTYVILTRMSAVRCAVSFTDPDGIAHTAHVQAESLYEAVALAVAEFRQDKLVPPPAPTDEFTVAIERPPIEHRIRLNQVAKWTETSTTREGPAGISKRQRLFALLALRK
jgi:hypothetical protein